MGTHPIFEADFDCLTEMEKSCLKRVLSFLLLSLASGGRSNSRDFQNRNKEANIVLQKLGWHLVAQAEGDENLVVSPFTIAGVLHMLAAGSQGDTRQEIITR